MAIFSWPERAEVTGPRDGDVRVVRRLVLLRKVAGEWRALGWELIEQRYEWQRTHEDGVVWDWSDKRWADAP